MSAELLGRATSHITNFGTVSTAVELSDGELLERFRAERDPYAFDLLVRRHGAMVLNVCKRVLRNHHDAEDAFQAAFLVLIRKAGVIRKRNSVGSWLHGVAYRTALKARTAAVRRRNLNETAAAIAIQEEPPSTLPIDVRPILDEELDRLPEKYRAPIVLCYLEGKTKPEAAAALECPEGTISGRLARARNILRDRLTRRGLAISGGALLAALTETATTSALAPAMTVLAFRLLVVAPSGTAVGGAAIPANVIHLAEGVIHGMFITRIKWAALAAVLVLALGAGGLIGYQALAVSAKNPAKPPPATESLGKTGPSASTPEKPPAMAALDSDTLKKWGETRQLKGHAKPVWKLAFDPKGATLASADEAGTIILWDAVAGKELFKLKGHNQMPCGLAFSPDGKALYSVAPEGKAVGGVCQDATLRHWEVATGKELGNHSLKVKGIQEAAFSPDGRTVAVRKSEFGSAKTDVDNSGVEIREVKSGKVLSTIKPHSGGTAFMAFSGDGKTLFTVGTETKEKPAGGGVISNSITVFRAWDTAKFEEKANLELGMNGASAFSPDGKLMVNATLSLKGNPEIRVYDLATLKNTMTIPGSAGAFGNLGQMAFTPDGKFLASGSSDKYCRIWDLSAGKEVTTLKGQTGFVYDCAFAPQGDYLVTSGSDNIIRFWGLSKNSK